MDTVSFPLSRPSVARSVRSRRESRRGCRWRKVMGCTWMAKGALELYIGLAAAGGQIQRSIAT